MPCENEMQSCEWMLLCKYNAALQMKCSFANVKCSIANEMQSWEWNAALPVKCSLANECSLVNEIQPWEWNAALPIWNACLAKK